jgi:signal transduction histidine kinase
MRTLWIYYNASWVLALTFNDFNKWFLFLWFICIYFVPYLFYRPGFIQLTYYLIAELLLTGSMFIYLMNQFHIIDVYEFLLLPFITIAYACQVRQLLWIGPVVSFIVFMIGSWAGHLFTDENFIGIFINTFLFYGIGFCLGRITVVNNKKKELIKSIQEKNMILEQYSKRIEELTIMEERNRVSQDLHDTVGHIFTSVITSLDALPFLLKANEEEAENSIKEISNLARKGLDDVRNTIHQLSPIEDQKSLSQSLYRIVDEFRKHTGTIVDFQLEGFEREIGQRIKYTLVRCLQEGLTNAKRHGQATRVFVELSYKGEALLLQIKDNGVGSDSLQLGFGLQTMKDRITSLNGSLSIKSEINEGTEILCCISLAKEMISI